MRARLTKRLLDKLVTENEGKSLLVWDQEVPGLVFRLRPDGAPAFAFQYKLRGRQRQVGLGVYGPMTLDGARDRATDLYQSVRAGGDPVAEIRERRQRRASLGDAAELYLADLRARAETGAARGRRSTIPEFERLIRKRILPRLGRIEVERLGLEEVEAWHRSLASTPASANRALTVLSAILRFAERRKLRAPGQNPCGLVARFREQPQRPRLSLDQIVALGKAMRDAESARSVHPSALLAIRLLALTGMRRSEVCGHGELARRGTADGLVWGDVDLQSKAIHLRAAKAGARSVPLGSAAVELLRAARPAAATADTLVCPGEVAGQPFIGLDKARRRLFVAAGIAKRVERDAASSEAATSEGKKRKSEAVEGPSLHALRRTYASVAADAGLGEYLIAGLLGHRGASVTSRYVSPDRDPLRHAAEVVCGTIAAALEGRPPAPVLDLSARLVEPGGQDAAPIHR